MTTNTNLTKSQIERLETITFLKKEIRLKYHEIKSIKKMILDSYSYISSRAEEGIKDNLENTRRYLNFLKTSVADIERYQSGIQRKLKEYNRMRFELKELKRIHNNS